MPSFPLNLQLAGRLALIVGAGKVALRKALALQSAGAHLRIVAPAADSEMLRLAASPNVCIEHRAYQSGDLDGAFLAIAATNDPSVNAAVIADARKAGALCSDAADPAAGDFTMPATLRLDEITIAVDTGGSSPSLAKRILTDVQQRLDPNYGRAAQTLSQMRDYVRGALPPDERANIMQQLSALPLQELATLNPAQAEHRVDELIEQLRGIDTTATTKALVCASRASQLALIQTRAIAAKLAQHGTASTILSVSTLGDRVQDRSIAAIGAENLFIKELELALRDGRAQYAVHSCKDLPSTLPEDMRIVAFSAREDARDAFCSQICESFAALPSGARVGTSSLRRRAQLMLLRPDLEYLDIRGNVDTRLRKLREGGYDAIVLAMAGLVRLGSRAPVTIPFEVNEVVPAVGQGALAVEMRAETTGTISDTIRLAVNDSVTELCVLAERAALAFLRGGCQAPIGIHARLAGERMQIEGVVVSVDGARSVKGKQRAAVRSREDAIALGIRLAEQLEASGAGAILAQNTVGVLSGRTIVLPRTQERPSRIAAALEVQGARVIQVRAGEAAPPSLGERVPDMIVFPSSGSVQAAALLLETWRNSPHRPAVAAMGPASAAAAAEQGFPADITAGEAQIDPLVAAVREYLLSNGVSRT